MAKPLPASLDISKGISRGAENLRLRELHGYALHVVPYRPNQRKASPLSRMDQLPTRGGRRSILTAQPGSKQPLV